MTSQVKRLLTLCAVVLGTINQVVVADEKEIQPPMQNLKASAINTNSENIDEVTNLVDTKAKADQLVQDGKVLYEMGKLEEARLDFERALKSDPNDEAALYYLNLTTIQIYKTTQSNFVPVVRTNLIFSAPGRQAIVSKLGRIHFDSILWSNGVPLSDVCRYLDEQSKLRDPEKEGVNFLWNPQGDGINEVNPNDINVKLTISNITLGDVLDAIVTVADHPIKYSIKDYGVVFSLKSNSTNLYTRTFRVDSNAFYRAMANVEAGSNTNDQSNSNVTNIDQTKIPADAARELFKTLGVDLTQPGTTIFYTDRLGLLYVRATKQDLDKVESIIAKLNSVTPQVHLKARFVEVEHNDALANIFTSTNATTRVLTDPDFRVLLHALEERGGYEDLAEPELIVTSGRQVKMRVTTPIEVPSYIDYSKTNHDVFPVFSNNVAVLPTLDALPVVLADGYTINLTLVPTLTGFSGYAGTSPTLPGATVANVVILPALLPKLTQRQFINTVNLWDGQTVAINESVLSGQSSSTNLLVFVTATIVDSAGNPLHSGEEMPFAQTNIPPQN